MIRIALVLALVASFDQTRTFQADPPQKCDDCAAWNKAREPFKLYGNSYYVGTDGLSAILITGDAGHVLLDGGLAQSAPLIDANIRRLGFRTEDVKLIVNSHAHFDHAGGINALQRHSGAVVAANAAGAKGLRDGVNTPDDPQVGFGREFNAFPAVTSAIRIIADGEVQRVGNIAVTPHFTPGHAPGSTTWTWQSCENGTCLNMVYADSISAVSAPGFRFSDRPELVAQLRRSITRVGELPCDVMVSTHPQFTRIPEKLARRATLQPGQPDPFIDSGLCKAYAASAMKNFENRLAEEKKK